ncbi:hypothetical protein Barb7_01367 [Bacteroidales bacterium Barb7]|nr:hypothetical protein Barb7_01367 [Bacteroidales bacterium Barb7]
MMDTKASHRSSRQTAERYLRLAVKTKPFTGMLSGKRTIRFKSDSTPMPSSFPNRRKAFSFGHTGRGHIMCRNPARLTSR